MLSKDPPHCSYAFESWSMTGLTLTKTLLFPFSSKVSFSSLCLYFGSHYSFLKSRSSCFFLSISNFSFFSWISFFFSSSFYFAINALFSVSYLFSLILMISWAASLLSYSIKILFYISSLHSCLFISTCSLFSSTI